MTVPFRGHQRSFQFLLVSAFSLLVLKSPLSAQLHTQNVTINMSDGTRLEATIGFPPSGGFPPVELIHGYGGRRDEMRQRMQVVAIYGYASLACRVP